VALVFDLPGGSFAFVMATGIVSIAAAQLGRGEIAAALFAINLVAFPLLCVLMLIRMFQRPATILSELRNYQTGAGFLTAVAAASILGSQFVLLASNRPVAAALWLLSLALWVGLIYAFFVAMTIRRVKPPLATGLDGAWLLTVVSTEAIAILATHVSGAFSQPDVVVFVGLCLFLLGGVLYLILISLIVQRWLFEPMRPEQLSPPYWINMGAAAITTLAGASMGIDCRRQSAGDRARPDDRGSDSAVLGARDLVDSTARDASDLAPCRAPDPSISTTGILVDGVSARHVHGRDRRFVKPKGCRISRSDTARIHLDRIGFLALRLCRNDTSFVAPVPPRTEELWAC
jgi:hypothetical protein